METPPPTREQLERDVSRIEGLLLMISNRREREREKKKTNGEEEEGEMRFEGKVGGKNSTSTLLLRTSTYFKQPKPRAKQNSNKKET